MGMQRFRSPALPLAPLEYDQQHMSQLIGALRLYFTQLDSNVPLQADGIRLLNLPTSGYNLPNGTVFHPTRLQRAFTDGWATAIKFANIGVQFARRHSLSGWRVLKSSPAKLCLCTRSFGDWVSWQCHNSDQQLPRNICNR